MKERFRVNRRLLVEAIEGFYFGKMAQEVMGSESKDEYLDFDEIREDLLKETCFGC